MKGRILVIRVSYWILIVHLRFFKGEQNVLFRQDKPERAGFQEKLQRNLIVRLVRTANQHRWVGVNVPR